MEENNNSVICVTGSRTYKLAVIDEKVKTPEEIYDKIIEDLLTFLTDWLVNHIMKVDKLITQ